MKKKIITTMLATAILAVGATKVYAANPLDGYDITIYDQTTPAVFAAGKDWPITTWYFYDEAHHIIGIMSGKDSLIIAQQYESFNPDGRWEFWFPKVFNDYRGLNGNSNSVLTVKAEENKVRDTEQWALEVIKLTNAERKKHGLPLFEVNDELMKLAQIRAEEVKELNSVPNFGKILQNVKQE